MRHCASCGKQINDRAADVCLICENPGMGIQNRQYGRTLQLERGRASAVMQDLANQLRSARRARRR